ncbi:MAG: asparagine synthase (glutamine-hydrolyzing) [Rhodothermales bacterium]|nr:asparagine synthase (glutamine-hydrolyzing) [Rhodothermales bacterium]MBO6781015.1 asparagine synthase (glutamine-hydrolyzing) [Rhodothermales bacterium]
MCGIAGILTSGGSSRCQTRDVLLQMRAALNHRGPDGQGFWDDGEVGIALAHTRLAILDLSAAGHQPMVSPNGRYVLSFNGEIYNSVEVRLALERERRVDWRGHSDTEVLLRAIQEWGLERALKKSVGMFAVAVWDQEGRQLSLARDRFGEKPLLYGRLGGDIVFASELRAIEQHPAYERKIDLQAMELFFRRGYIPAPLSAVEGIRKVLPGQILRFSSEVGELDPARTIYWNLDHAVGRARSTDVRGGFIESRNQIRRLLERAIRGQLHADVPVGVLLSGGIDSSLVAAIAQGVSLSSVRTFTIGFDEAGFDEGHQARALAKQLGTEHQDLYLDATSVRDLVPELAATYDEPFADPSALPTLLLSRLVRGYVTVALSGDGGDESFCGYQRYLGSRVRQMWVMNRALGGFPSRSLFRSMGIAESVLSSARREKLRRLSALLDAEVSNNFESFYTWYTAKWLRSPIQSGGGPLPATAGPPLAGIDFERRMMALDTASYLPDDILVKVDRAAMSVGLETRAPFLDHRLVEFAWGLPLHYLRTADKGKLILRDLLDELVGGRLSRLPKKGFSAPIATWLRGPLRDWAEDLLAVGRLDDHGWLDSAEVRRRWQEHLSGTVDWSESLWGVLMLNSWASK